MIFSHLGNTELIAYANFYRILLSEKESKEIETFLLQCLKEYEERRICKNHF